MSIVNVRREIATFYEGALDSVQVSEHGGAFSTADIKRYARRTPALIVACLGLPNFEFQGSTVVGVATFGAFCMVADSSRERRDIGALLLAESVVVETFKNFWNGAATSTPRNVSAANLYSPALDKLGIAMWAVKWDQLVDLQRNAVAQIDDFKTMSGQIDAIDSPDTTPILDILELPQ